MPPKKAKPAPQPGVVPVVPATEEYAALEAQLRDLQQQEAKWSTRLQGVAARKQKLEASLEEVLAECKERQQAVDRIFADFRAAIEPPNSRTKPPPKPRREDAVEQALEESRLREAGIEFLKRFFRRPHVGTLRKPGSAGTPSPRSPLRPLPLEAAPTLPPTPSPAPSPGTTPASREAGRPWRRGSASGTKRRPEEEEAAPEGVDPGVLHRVRDLRDARWQQEEALAVANRRAEELRKQLAELQKFEDLDQYAVQAVKFRLEPVQKAMKEQLDAWMAEYVPPTPCPEGRRVR